MTFLELEIIEWGGGVTKSIMLTDIKGDSEDDELATIDMATNQMAPYSCRECHHAYLPDTNCLPQFIGTSLALAIPLFMKLHAASCFIISKSVCCLPELEAP